MDGGLDGLAGLYGERVDRQAAGRQDAHGGLRLTLRLHDNLTLLCVDEQTAIVTAVVVGRHVHVADVSRAAEGDGLCRQPVFLAARADGRCYEVGTEGHRLGPYVGR